MGSTKPTSAETGICVGRFASAQENLAGDDVAWKVYVPVLQRAAFVKGSGRGPGTLQVHYLMRRGAREGQITTREVQHPAHIVRHSSCKRRDELAPGGSMGGRNGNIPRHSILVNPDDHGPPSGWNRGASSMPSS